MEVATQQATQWLTQVIDTSFGGTTRPPEPKSGEHAARTAAKEISARSKTDVLVIEGNTIMAKYRNGLEVTE